MVQVVQNRTQRPSAIVCIAYRQLSTMTGIKDPTEQPKMEIVEECKETNVVAETSFTDFRNIYMQDFFKFSKNMADSFRTMYGNLKVHIEQFHEQNRSIFDMFSFSHLQKWFQREH